jgi:hypothetical protein
MSGDWKTPPGGEGQKSAAWDSDATVASWPGSEGKQGFASVDPRSAGAEGSFTEVTTTSWFERVKGAFVGVLIGLLFVPGSAWMLFWNEGRAVQTSRSLSEGAASVQAADAGRIDPALDGRLIHVAGPITVAGPLRDPDFGVQAQGALRIVRSVEMYQWREERRSETRTNLGGSQETVTTYNYTRGWSSQAIDSSRFRQPEGRFNPQMRFPSRDTVAPEARLGARRLTEEQIRGFGEPRPLPLDAAAFMAPAGAIVTDGGLYVGRDPQSPQIGDLRIRFSLVPADSASVVAAQRGDGFAPFQTRAGDRVMLMRTGTVPAAAMFQAAEEGNRIFTWVLRAVGVLLMFIGFGMIFRPLSVLGSVVPVVGSIIGAGAGLVSGILTLVIAPLVIAVAWIFYRPVIGILVLVVGMAGAAGLTWLARQRRAAAPPAPAR